MLLPEPHNLSGHDNIILVSMRCAVCGTPDPVMLAGPIEDETLCFQCSEWLGRILMRITRKFMD